MPIEVRELVIKATVLQDGTAGAPASTTGGNNSVSPNEEMIKTAIEKMMEILKEKKER
ncbi:MAG TPA: DUF5908 family protein [Chitinophagaceae bacterium]|nr:DUF5908 family protein [Chitinophagaceae bacterium]